MFFDEFFDDGVGGDLTEEAPCADGASDGEDLLLLFFGFGEAGMNELMSR